MAYNDGTLVRRNDNSTWQLSQGEDFFFKAFFNTPVAPVKTEVLVDFNSADYTYGAIVNDSGNLITDVKFIIAALVDDTSSMSWSDPVSQAYKLKTFLPDFFTTLFTRTANTSVTNYPGYNNDKYQTSFLDFWLFSNVEINRSLGYSNSISDIRTFASSLYQRGFKSNLLETAPIVINGLNYQSIVDAFIKQGQQAESAVRVDYLVKYLVQKNSLRLDDIYSYWVSIEVSSRSQWGVNYQSTQDKTNYINTIKDYSDVSDFVVKRWAKTFIALSMIFSDGDNTTRNLANVSLTSAAANAAWGDNGVPVYTFGLGKSHRESALRTMSDSTDGIHFHVATDSDWSAVQSSLLHGGNYSLYGAYWTKVYDYNDPIWISQISASYSALNNATGRFCSVEARWSEDRVNFTNWISIASGEQNAFILKKEILVLEYRIKINDGWNTNTNTLDPASVSYVKHIQVSPSILFLVTPPQKISGMMFETLLNATAALPLTATATWGICRGNSTEFEDFLPVHVSRKGALPNRQQGIQFTDEILEQKLPTQLIDAENFKYVVLKADSSGIRTWLPTDIITVYFNNDFVARPSYLDGTTGTVQFDIDVSGNTVTVDIKTPSNLFTTVGETTSTNDYRTYYLSNGRWPNDSKIIVLINGKIVLGGFTQNPEEGSITFFREKEKADVVSVFVQNSDVYRVGVEIRNFDPSLDNQGNPLPLNLDNFALFYSMLDNAKFIEQAETTIPPVLILDENNLYVKINPRTLNLQGAVIQPSIFQRLTISYKYYSENDLPESGTQIKWYRYRANLDTSSFAKKITVNGLTYVQLTENQIYNYDNRLTQKKIHVGDTSQNAIFKAGDKILINVIPSDGFNTGIVYSSEIITLASDLEPYIITLKPAPNTNTSNISNPTLSLTLSSNDNSSNFSAGTYKIGYTYSNSSGETALSALQTITIAANKSIQIKPPTNFQIANATAVNYYCSVTPGSNSVYMALKTGEFILNTIISDFRDQVFIFSSTLTFNDNGDSTSKAGSNLVAKYVFKNPSGTEFDSDNKTFIEWYEVGSGALIASGTRADTLLASKLVVGKTYNFRATPFNGNRYGQPVFSSNILIIA